jgi:DNA-binding transcriptional ArsR family regulator
MTMSGLDEEPYSGIFNSLKHPVRRKILRMLSEKPNSFSEILESLGVSSSYLTYHLESLGQLVSKTDDGKYKLSNFGEAAVGTMSRVEEIPRITERKAPALPMKWKYFFASLMIGLVILGGVSYIQYQSLSKVSAEDEPVKELVDLAGNESLDARVVGSWYLRGLNFTSSIGAYSVVYSPYDNSIMNLDLSTTWYEAPSFIPISVQEGNVFALTSNETAPVIWGANATGSNTFLVTLAHKGWYTLSLAGSRKSPGGTPINDAAMSPKKVIYWMRVLMIYKEEYAPFVVTVPPLTTQVNLPIGPRPDYTPSNATWVTLPEMPFDMRLNGNKLVVLKGESVNISVTIYCLGEANISLAVGQGDIPEFSLPPPGIVALFDQPWLSIRTNSTVTVNLTISILNEAASGTYELTVSAERTDKPGVGQGVPLEVTVL